jgi:hypothetical protein
MTELEIQHIVTRDCGLTEDVLLERIQYHIRNFDNLRAVKALEIELEHARGDGLMDPVLGEF